MVMIDNSVYSRIARTVETAKQARRVIDQDMDRVRQIRRGRLHELFPEEFSDDLERSIAANTIDNMARDQAELFAPLPALSCYSKNMVTESDERRAMTRNKIGNYYLETSVLALQNVDFCDALNSYGFGVYVVEPDFEKQCPVVRWESSFGSYYGKSRYGDVRWFAKVHQFSVAELCDMFPDYAHQIKPRSYNLPSEKLDVIQYVDAQIYVTYVPGRDNLVLLSTPNLLGRCPVVVAERHDQESDPRGQFDDTVWPTLASALMQTYMLRAAYQIVNAPLIVGTDVSDVPFGPDAIIPTDNPNGVTRLNLQLPGETFALNNQLDRSIKEGARYPEARTGAVQGNIITGKGVEALMGTMDTQVMTMQKVVGHALEQVISLCFEMDVAYWPKVRKTIYGTYSGKAYHVTYTPEKELTGTFGVKVSYGFATGMAPANAMVALLQLLGGGLISRDTARMNLPFDIDIAQEQQAIDVQEMNDGLKQGLLASLQAMSVIVTQGGDPTQLLLAGAKAIELRQKGTELHKAVQEAFTPPEPTEEELAMQEAMAGAPAGPSGPEGMPPGMGETGLMQGVPVGQAGKPPGGMPNVMSLLSSLRGNGDGRMEASTIRKQGIGT